MAYILNRAFINAQLAAVGIAPAELDEASFDSKVAALNAVANASAAATQQVLLPIQLEVGSTSDATGLATKVLIELQAQLLRQQMGLPPAG